MRESCLDSILEAGEYYLQVDANWDFDINSLSLSVTGPELVDIQESSEIDFIDFLESVMKNRALTFSGTKWTSYSKNSKFRTGYCHSKMGYGYFYFENKSKTQSAEIGLKITKRKGIMMGKYYFSNKILTISQ